MLKKPIGMPVDEICFFNIEPKFKINPHIIPQLINLIMFCPSFNVGYCLLR